VSSGTQSLSLRREAVHRQLPAVLAVGLLECTAEGFDIVHAAAREALLMAEVLHFDWLLIAGDLSDMPPVALACAFRARHPWVRWVLVDATVSHRMEAEARGNGAAAVLAVAPAQRVKFRGTKPAGVSLENGKFAAPFRLARDWAAFGMVPA